MQPRRFILTAFDPEYGHPSYEALLIVERPEELRTLLDLSAEQDPGLEMSYRLEPQEAAAIARHFGVQFAPLEREAFLRPWHTLREAPYMLVWMAVDEPTLSSIEFAACRALPRQTGNLRLVCSFDERPGDREPGSLIDTASAVALVKARVKARGFVELIGSEQKPYYELPPERVAALNHLIVGKIEVVARPAPETVRSCN